MNSFDDILDDIVSMAVSQIEDEYGPSYELGWEYPTQDNLSGWTSHEPTNPVVSPSMNNKPKWGRMDTRRASVPSPPTPKPRANTHRHLPQVGTIGIPEEENLQSVLQDTFSRVLKPNMSTK